MNGGMIKIKHCQLNNILIGLKSNRNQMKMSNVIF